MSIDLDAIKARLASVAGKWPTTGVLAPGADEFGPKAWSAHGPLRCHATEQGRARQWTQANADADFIAAAPGDIAALVEEVERLRALEADAERARVKADLWSYYEAFVAANGAGSITELVTQRDEARAEAATMRAWNEDTAAAENANTRDLKAARDTIRRLADLVRHQRGPLHDAGLVTDEEYAALAGDHAAVARLEGYDALRAGLANIEQIVRDGMVVARHEGRAAERAAVVAWLRARGVEIENWPPGGRNEISLTYSIIADDIERGEHRREEAS